MISQIKNYGSQHSQLGLEPEPNLIELFKPLYILLSWLGLFPCSITFPKRKYSSIKVKSLAVNFLCALSMSIFMTVFFAVKVIPILSITISMTDITHVIKYVLLVICSIVSYSSAYAYRHSYVKMLNIVSTMWMDLSNAETSYILKRFRFLVRLLVMGWLLFLLGGQMTFSCISKNLIEAIWIVVPEMVPSGIVIFYDVMGLMVVSLLKSIDNHCQKRIKSENNIDINIIRVQTKQPLITITQMKMCYVKALEVKREINRVFQAAVLVITIQTFHTILCEAHYVYHGLIKTREFKLFDVVQELFWIVYQSMKIYALSVPGTMIKNEEINIGQTLLCIPADNVNILAEVQHFSSLMCYQGTMMTAYGYFALDATLIFNTLATVITYLVILVQFDN